MARVGQAISNPVSGERVEFRQTSAATGGELLQWVHVLEPGRRVPADHVHWAQEERFEILSGTATVRLGKQTLILMPGDDLVIPAGTAHGLRNEGTDQLRVLTELRLAMRTEHYFETVFGLAQRRQGRQARSPQPAPRLGDRARPGGAEWGRWRSDRTHQRPRGSVRICGAATGVPRRLSRMYRYRLLAQPAPAPGPDTFTPVVAGAAWVVTQARRAAMRRAHPSVREALDPWSGTRRRRSHREQQRTAGSPRQLRPP